MALHELATTSEAAGPVTTEAPGAVLEQQARAATGTATNVASPSIPNENQSAEINVSVQRQDAETEAQDALRKAIQSIKALRSLATINLSDEFSQLSTIMSEFSMLPGVSKSQPQEDETPSGPPDEHIPAAKQAPSEPSDSKSRQIATERMRPCVIERLTMDDWRKHLLNTLGPRNGGKIGRVLPFNKNEKNDTAPLIQAFYRTVPSISAGMDKKYTEQDFDNAYAAAQKTEKPQRILINSPLLLMDLEKISGLALPNTAFEMIPPFKLLIHNWEGIQSTLERLTIEYEELCSHSKASTSATEVQPVAIANTTETPYLDSESPLSRAESASAQIILSSIAQQNSETKIEENYRQSSNDERHTIPRWVSPDVDNEQALEKATLEIQSVAAPGNPGLMTIKLEKRNFAKVARTATEFEDYINAVRGDDARNALDSKQRDDYFAQQLAPQPRKNRGGVVYYGSSSKSVKGKKSRTKPVDSDGEDNGEDEKPLVQKGKSKQRKDRFTDSEDEDSDESDGLSD